MFRNFERPDDPILSISMNNWRRRKPMGFSACIRVCNEQEWLERSVESVLPYANEVILAVQPSLDNTEDIARNLQDKYPDIVKVYEYSVNVNWFGSPLFNTTPVNSIYSAIYMSNWALSKCNYHWVIKMEADVVLLDNFEKIYDKVRHSTNTEKVYYGWYILNVAGKNMDQYSHTHPRNHGTDEAIFQADPYWHFIKHEKWEMVNFLKRPHWICTDWGGLHMKRCKEIYSSMMYTEKWKLITKDNIVNSMLAYHTSVNRFHGYGNHKGIPELWEKGWTK